MITTKNLPEHIFKWVDRERKLSPKEREKLAGRGNKSLWHMNTIFCDWWLFGYIPP
jgi:hypothetical protein